MKYKEIKTNIDVRVSHESVIDYYPIKLKETTPTTNRQKFWLRFYKKRYFHEEHSNTQLVYKIMRGKTFILNHYILPVMHPMCRCTMINI